MAIKVIVFDLGKVLFDFDIPKLSKGISLHSDKSLNELSNFINTRWDSAFAYEKGEMTSTEFYNTVKKNLSFNAPYETFTSIWNDIFTPMEQSINFLKNLKKLHLPVALLSNTNELHFDYLSAKHPEVFDCFNDLHVSHKMSARKPESKIYADVINFYKMNPSEIFFTDDLDINIEAAKSAGIKGYTFKNVEKLTADLQAEGVNV